MGNTLSHQQQVDKMKFHIKHPDAVGNELIDGISGVINVIGGAFGLPEIPKVNKDDPSVGFGHKKEEANYAQQKENDRHDKAKTDTLAKINEIKVPELTLPDIKPTASNQNFAMPPVYVPKEPVVDAVVLKQAQDEIVLQQEIMYGTIGVGGLIALYFLKGQ